MCLMQRFLRWSLLVVAVTLLVCSPLCVRRDVVYGFIYIYIYIYTYIQSGLSVNRNQLIETVALGFGCASS